jgi:signal transduction histidine kinase/CheY-like chemotaxis protein
LHTETDDLIHDKIHIEQIKILHDSIPSLLLVNVLVGCALAYGFWDVIPHQSIVICLLLLLAMVLVRGVFFLGYKKHFNPDNIKPYRLSLIIGGACAGMIWGAIGILFFPVDEQNYQVFILFALMAMTGGSAFTLAIYLPSFFAFVPITLLPIIIQLFLLADKFHIALGMATMTFLLVLTSFNIKVNKNFKTSLMLRFKNLALIAQLQQQKDEAERANKAKSKFLAAASHDLRQPLYSLGLFTTVLDETIKYPKVKKVVEQMNTAVSALTNLFDKLLDISQLDAGVIKVKKHDFPLNAIFDKLIQSFNSQAKEKNIMIHWPTKYPSVHSEADLLEQILRNYLSNALKYTRQGEINVQCEVHKEMVHIHVSDTGVGINKEDFSDIYEEFYQISNPERDREKGLGLGLSIVKRTAKLLEHEIAVSSEAGKGSRFSISVNQAENIIVGSVDTTDADKKAIPGDPALIVVIDDAEDIRQGLDSLLQLWGYSVIVAGDLENALLQLKTNNLEPDVIISDYRLKEGKTGIDAIRAIQLAYDTEIPALIITGDIATERLIEMNSSHFQVLFKPVPPMKLRSFLRSVKS